MFFEVESVFEHGDVLRQIPFVYAPERPEIIPQPRPKPLTGVAVYLSDAVAVVVAGKLPLAVGDGRVFTPRIGHPVVGTCLVGVKPAALFGLGLDFGLDLVNARAQADR